MGGDINITYETLFDLLRRERSREEIQELDVNFTADLNIYLQKKNELLANQVGSDLRKAELQLENINKIVKELYERREKKILTMAISKSRTGADVMDSNMLLSKEKELYAELVAVLDKYREKVFTTEASLPAPTVNQTSEPSTAPLLMKIQFLQPVPRFLGREMEKWGPFDTGETAELPSDIAKILVAKGRAENSEV